MQVSVDDSILVEADADRLAQVFSNLLQNTLRYTEAPARLSIQAVIDGSNARIEWEDSSPGVGGRPAEGARLIAGRSSVLNADAGALPG